MNNETLGHDIQRAIGHILETNGVRRIFWHMDDRVENLSYGIQQGGDAIVVGRMVFNMEGPYPLKTGRKTGLIHTCSDIVVMGGKPLFAFDSMQVDSIKEAEEVAGDLKKQSIGLGVPIIGGNTQLETGLKPCISFAAFGMLVDKPISDCCAKKGDRILMLGEIVEGEIGERVYRAKVKYDTFLELIEKKIEIHSAKDISRGGWFGNLAEMMIKSKKGIKITSIPYPRVTRYMGNYILSVPRKEIKKIIEISAKHQCPVVEVGTVTGETEMLIGDEIVLGEERMNELIRDMPHRRSRVVY